MRREGKEKEEEEEEGGEAERGGGEGGEMEKSGASQSVNFPQKKNNMSQWI